MVMVLGGEHRIWKNRNHEDHTYTSRAFLKLCDPSLFQIGQCTQDGTAEPSTVVTAVGSFRIVESLPNQWGLQGVRR